MGFFDWRTSVHTKQSARLAQTDARRAGRERLAEKTAADGQARTFGQAWQQHRGVKQATERMAGRSPQWCPDPRGQRDTWRWWDGQQFTDQTAPFYPGWQPKP